MSIPRFYRYCLMLVSLLCLVSLQAQQPPKLSPALQAFTAKDYAGYLKGLPTELAPAADRPQAAFPSILATAIALEKTKSWTGATGKQAIELLAKSKDATRYLQALKQLVEDDAHGLTALYDGPPPSPFALSTAARLAKEHDCTLAYNCLEAVSPDMQGRRVQAWLSIPKEKRAPVDEFLAKQIDPTNMRMLAEMMLNFYVDPPKDLGPIDPDELLAYAKKYANGLPVVSFKTAERLLQVNKRDQGLQMAREVAALAPADLETQRYAARLFWGCQKWEDAAKLFQDAADKVPPPESRGARLTYLDFLDWVANNKVTVPNLPDLTGLQTAPDPLLAADATFAAGKMPEATAKYRAAVVDPKLPLERRLEAWSGLLDTEPDAALPIGSHLLNEITRGDSTKRTERARWFGWEVARTLQREKLLPVGYVRLYSHRFAVAPHGEIAAWAPTQAAWYAQLTAVDPAELLRYDSQKGGTLRLPIATANLFAHQPEQAAEILLRRVAYQVPPPDGGWKYGDGTPRPDAYQPRQETTPTEGELARTWEPLFTTFRQAPALADDLAPFAAYLARGTAVELQDAKLNESQVKSRVQLLQQCLRLHAAAQDPPAASDTTPRPQRPADLAAFAILDNALRDALAQDAVVKASPALWQDAFLPALLTVRNPKLVDGFFNLLTFNYDRYQKVTGKSNLITASANDLAQRMDTYQYPPRPDLKPYAQRLREKYGKEKGGMKNEK